MGSERCSFPSLFEVIAEKNIKKAMKRVGILAIVAIIVGVIGVQKMKFNSTLHALNVMDSTAIISFKIYPTAGQPGDPFVEFERSDPIVVAFLKSVTDFRSSSVPANSVTSFEHCWSIEILTEKRTIQMGCYIPSEQTQVVLGYIGKFSPTSAIYYGQFQSQLLYQWYQKYSHLWLETESSTRKEPSSH
jgi:hypothetical protein